MRHKPHYAGMSLTSKQQSFANAIIAGLNPSEAYREAGYSCSRMSDASIAKEAQRLLDHPHISPIIQGGNEEVKKQAVIRKSDLLNDLNDLRSIANGKLTYTDDRGRQRLHQGNAYVFMGATKELLPYAQDDMREETERFIADFALHIGKAFVDAHRSISYREHVDYWFSGGRGSLKSSFASLEVVYHLEQNPDHHAVVLMKHKEYIRDATYAQIVWAIKELGLEDDYEFPESTFRIKKKSTGQLILFRGCDKPDKMKSVKVPFGKIGIVWFEEVDQFNGMAEIRKVTQSVTRGKDDETGSNVIRLYTFNPPRSVSSWVNKEMERRKDKGLPVYVSTYLDAPAEWLGRQFFADAEDLKESDPDAHAHEYMGLATGTGGNVFDLVKKVIFREITDKEIATFDNIHCGQDFGFSPDPWAYTMHEYQPGSQTILSFYEDGATRTQPDEQAKRIKEAQTWADSEGRDPEFHYLVVLSDDGRNDLIEAQYDFGVNARQAHKGNMRKASYGWLSFVTWVIDPVRCPELAQEVREMEYVKNKDDEWTSAIPDKNDHYIDSTRYAFMSVIRNSRFAYRKATQDE